MNINIISVMTIIILLSISACRGQSEVLTLNQNPSFEVVSNGIPDNWSWDGAKTAVSVIDESPIGEYGSRCVQFDLTSVERKNSGLFFMSDYIPIDPQKTYLQSGWIRNEGLMPDGYGTSMLRRFFDKDKKYIPSANGGHYIVKNIGPTKWTWYSGKMVPDLTPADEAKEDVEIPANAAYVRIGAISYAYPRKAWIDGFRIEEYREGIPAPAAGNDRLAYVKVVSATPKVDGVLDEDAWNDGWSDGFRQTVCSADKAVYAKVGTSFKVLADSKNVYIGIRCQRKPGTSLAVVTRKNGDVAVANDDCVELFLDPTGQRQNFVHIIVNCEGYNYVGLNNRNVSLDLLTAAKSSESSWELEMSLSRDKLWQLFDEADMACDKVLWNFNMTRHQPNNPDDRYTSWSFTGEAGFHNKETLGYLLLDTPENVIKTRLNTVSQKSTAMQKANKALLDSADEGVAEVKRIKLIIKSLLSKTGTFANEIAEQKKTDNGLNEASFCRLMPELSQLPLTLASEYEALSRLSLTLPKNRQAYGYLLYKTPLFERPSDERIPQKQELVSKLSIRTAQNEITAGTFSIFSKYELQNVTITSTDFKNAAGKKLPKSAVDVRILEPFGKRTESDILATDLSITLKGWLKNYAANKRFIPEIPANKSRKLWVTVNAANIQPGKYSGSISISPTNRKATKLAVDIEVMPFKLPESNRMLGYYYSGVINPDPGNPPGGSNYMFYNGLTTVESCTEEFKHLRTSGFNFLMIEGYANGPFNVDYCRKILTCARNAGFDRVCLLGGEHLITKGIAETPEEQANIEKSKVVFKERAEKVLLLMKELGFTEYYLYGADEPHTPNDIERNRIIAEEAHKFGGKVMVAFIFEDNMKTLKGIMDVPIMSWASMASAESEVRDSLAANKSIPFEKVAYYANLVANQTPLSRLTFGWYMFKSNFQGNIPWAYYYLHLKWEPFNVDDFPYDTAFYVYPTLDKPIPTLKFEASREGVNDLRYLEYIKTLLPKCKDEKRKKACQSKLDKMLMEISLVNDKGPQSANYILPPQRLDQFRKVLQDMALSLQNPTVKPGK